MFEKLTIKNYLLLKNIDIEFASGFNVITGETGAGKSIMIDALSLLMGERADYSIIGKNKEKMIIEGLVKPTENNLNLIENLLKKNEIENIGPENLIIRRELYSKGFSRSFINDTPVGLNVLSELGTIIIDIHSQNEHQSLLKKDAHIELLDAYLRKTEGKKYIEKVDLYKKDYFELLNTINETDKIKNKKEELDNKRNFIEFQLKEILEVNPVIGEDNELEEELKTGENIENIKSGLSEAYNNLYDDSGSVIERIKIVEKELSKISEYNSEINKILKDISESSLVLNEAGRLLQSLIDNLSFDPNRVEYIRDRLHKLQFLKKKYGGTLQETVRIKDTYESELSLVDNFDEKINELEKSIRLKKEKVYKKAKEISETRKEKSRVFENEITKVLNEVGLDGAEFRVYLKNNIEELPIKLSVKDKRGYIKLSESGIDNAEFLVKINKGEEFSSLTKTASGGEVSRIMLVVKSVLSDADKVGILVFDEIDIGISGRVAQKVGKVMKKLSQNHQVIAITHLAQIAALAEEHMLVEKEEESGHTSTKIRKLDKNEKVIEVARLLSGEKVTDASIKSAKELMMG